jgi:hypothetical protein
VRDRIAAKFNVRSVGKLPKKLNFSRLSVRPLPLQSDLEAALKKLRCSSPSLGTKDGAQLKN